jgi:hypothetical protein
MSTRKVSFQPLWVFLENNKYVSTICGCYVMLICLHIENCRQSQYRDNTAYRLQYLSDLSAWCFLCESYFYHHHYHTLPSIRSSWLLSINNIYIPLELTLLLRCLSEVEQASKHFSPHQEIISFCCIICLHSLAMKTQFLLVYVVMPPSLKHLKLYKNVVTLHVKKIENFSYFYLKIELFLESGEEVMCNKRVNLKRIMKQKYKKWQDCWNHYSCRWRFSKENYVSCFQNTVHSQFFRLIEGKGSMDNSELSYFELSHMLHYKQFTLLLPS